MLMPGIFIPGILFIPDDAVPVVIFIVDDIDPISIPGIPGIIVELGII